MNLDLFDSTWVLVCSGFVAIGLYYILRDYLPWPKKPKKTRSLTKKRAIVITSIALVASISIYLYVCYLYPSDTIPPQLVLWALPLGIGLGTLPFAFIVKKKRVMASTIVPVGLLLGLLCANNYYLFYPTPGSLFSKNKGVNKDSQTTTKNNTRKTPLEAYYSPLDGQPDKGQLLDLNIPSNGSFKPKAGYIYLPPALAKNTSLTLPVIVLLAGYPGAPVDWIHGGLEDIMNNFAADHKGLAPIVAVVDENGINSVDTECVNSGLGDVETYLVRDVPSYLKTHYQVEADASAWAIGGYSAGGTCATTVAARNPNVYQTYMSITAEAQPNLNTPLQTLNVLFNGSRAEQTAHNPTAIFATYHNPYFKTMHAWYYEASLDAPALISQVGTQATTAARAGVDVSYQAVTGHHGFYIWKEGYAASLSWFLRNTDTIN